MNNNNSNSQEIIYSSDNSSLDGDINSAFVRNLANDVYGEFQSMISIYGVDAIKNLLPMIVCCLETLNNISNDKENLECELENLKIKSNDVTQLYENEKDQRKIVEKVSCILQKCIFKIIYRNCLNLKISSSKQVKII